MKRGNKEKKRNKWTGVEKLPLDLTSEEDLHASLISLMVTSFFPCSYSSYLRPVREYYSPFL